MAQEYPQEMAKRFWRKKPDELKDVRPADRLHAGKRRRPAEAKPELAPEPKPQRNPATAAAKQNREPDPAKNQRQGRQDRAKRQGFWEAVFIKNITMIYIPEGEFTIGSPAREGDEDEHPAHKVFLSGYWIGKTEVTFAQFDAFCQETGLEKPEDEGWGRGERPVIYVSWKEANDFCAWLEEKDGLGLPSADRGRMGKSGPRPLSLGQSLRRQATWPISTRNIMKTSPVGSYPEGASPYGVLDMAGNVWEWLADWYAADYYENLPRYESRKGPESGEERAVRGGSWANNAELIRSANRSSENPESKLNILGFRLALDNH